MALGVAGLGCGGTESSSGGACQTARDCVAEETCVAGRCVGVKPDENRCREDGDCESGEFCDAVSGLCRLLSGAGDAGISTEADAGSTDLDAGPRDAFEGPCERDEQCGSPPADICFEMQCVRGCGEPGGLTCTGGQTCDPATGRCRRPVMSCAEDSDCGPPAEICEGGMCRFGCGVDPGLCGPDELCDPSTGRCVLAPTPCMGDSDCAPPRTVCEGTQCVPGCEQPGGVQCAGTEPHCNPMTGRCQSTPVSGGPGCVRDADCMDPTQICEAMQCVPRCDAPGGACPVGQVCATETGRCVPGGLGLGDTCTLDGQCTTDLCLPLDINMATVRACSRPCGAEADCPLGFRCGNVSGMSFCLAGSLFNPPARFDVPAGGMCSMSNNTCQSGWCNTQTQQCLETCQRDSHCASFGGRCFMFNRTENNQVTWQPLCVQQSGSTPGAACSANSNCRSGVCNRYERTCAQFCCSSSDCPTNQVCRAYDLDPNHLTKVCQPAGAGTAALGATCATGADCRTAVCIPTDPAQMGSPRQCSTLCCTDADCAALPRGGVCRPFNGPLMGSLVGACIPN